jgi:hypothetical protein
MSAPKWGAPKIVIKPPAEAVDRNLSGAPHIAFARKDEAVDISKTGAIERIARVLAAQRLSSNAEGSQPSAAPDVDDAWPDYREDAVAVLKTLREPDEAMAAAADPAIWTRMISAALGIPVEPFESAAEPPEIGSDPMNEGP